MTEEQKDQPEVKTEPDITVTVPAAATGIQAKGSTRPKAEEEAMEVAEFVKEMPKPVRRKFEMSMMQMFSGGPGAMLNPLFDKVTEKHIDKFLDYSQRDDDNKFRFHSSNRWFKLVYVLIAVAVLIFIIVFFANDKQTLNEILKLLGIFVGGVGSGYGLHTLRNRE